MYKFVQDIDPKQHDEFVKNSPICALLQSSSWANIKDNWDHEYVGVYDDQKLICSSLVLIKKLPFSLTMMYIPRGPIMDYENKELVQYYFKSLKKWAKRYSCLFIKFDPAIIYKEYLLKEKDTASEKENIQHILKNLQSAEAIHMGFTKEMNETIQPRYQMGLYRCDDLSKHISKDAYKSHNAAVRKHVFAKRYGKEKLKSFADIMVSTEERKQVALRNYDYFEKLMDVYQDHAYLFIVSVDPKIRFKEVQQELQEIEEKMAQPNLTMKASTRLNKDYLNIKKEYDSLKEIAEKYDGVQDIAGALMIGYGNTIEMLYAGMKSEFKAFRPQDYLYYERFNFAFEQGYEYASMGGVEGSLEDGLTVYKSKYNTLVREYIGEFDLPVNRFLYKLSRMAYTMRKKKKV
ncbi:MAG: peptidoglycan bridge formation glycyltransferase FemA/FemB family protein [Traorella sp.]